MNFHSLETVCPKFKYEIIAQYNDPLRRQLNEAINIMHLGGLNRKMEFGKNELCRLEPAKGEFDRENLFQAELRERKVFKAKMENFISVMSAMECINDREKSSKTRSLTDIYDCRFKRKAKKAKMDCSTPVSARRDQPPAPGMEESPIEKVEPVLDEISLEKSGGDALNKMSKTGISQEATKLFITPPVSETSSVENRRLFTTAQNWSDAASKKGIKSRTQSEPRNSTKLCDNVIYKDFPARIENISLSPMRKRSNSLVKFLNDNSLSPWVVDRVSKLKEDVEKLNIVSLTEATRKLMISPIRIPTTGGIAEQTLGLSSTKRKMVASPEDRLGHCRKVSIGEGSSPILKMVVDRAGEGRLRAHTVGSPYVMGKNQAPMQRPYQRDRTTSCDSSKKLPKPSNKKRKRVTPKLRLAAKFDLKEGEDGGAITPKRKQALISNMFQPSPKGYREENDA